MAKLIHIESSPRKERSHSIEVAQAFIEAYSASHPDDEVVTLDVWEMDLPEINGFAIKARYKIMHDERHSPEEAQAWKAVLKTFEQFSCGNKYLFSVPMWNYSIPYKLKHFIDVICQPGLTFTASPTGSTGLIRGKPAAVIYARGGEYIAHKQPKVLDFQKPYFEMLLKLMGFHDVTPIVLEPTVGARQDDREAALENAKLQARRIAVLF